MEKQIFLNIQYYHFICLTTIRGIVTLTTLDILTLFPCCFLREMLCSCKHWRETSWFSCYKVPIRFYWTTANVYTKTMDLVTTHFNTEIFRTDLDWVPHFFLRGRILEYGEHWYLRTFIKLTKENLTIFKSSSYN